MRTARLPVIALLLLAPVCAEILYGYDDSTGDPAALALAMLFFVPLYGAPAVLVREIARRLGLGWAGILLLAAAFGVVQAGLVDQSMFSRSYRDIPWWSAASEPTFIEPLQVSVYLVVTFVTGHVVQSIGAPIALVETLFPGRRHEPWLRPWAIVVVSVLYVAASAVILADHLATENDHASAGQLVGAGLAAAGLVVAAVTLGRRPEHIVPGRVPAPWVVGVGAALGGMSLAVLPPSRWGTAGVIAVLATAVVMVWHLSRRGDWSQAHVGALAGGALVGEALVAFTTTPLGDVSEVAKYAHNVALLALMVGLSVAGQRVGRRRAVPAGST